MTTLQPFILKITSPPSESEYSQFQLKFSTIKVFHFFSTCDLLGRIFEVPFNSFEFEKIRKFALRWPWSCKAERVQMHQSGQLFTFDPNICIGLFSNEPSDAERIKIDARRLVHKIKETPSGGLHKKQPKRTLGQKTALTLRARNWRRNAPRILKRVFQTWPRPITILPLKSSLKWETDKLHRHSLQ